MNRNSRYGMQKIYCVMKIYCRMKIYCIRKIYCMSVIIVKVNDNQNVEIVLLNSSSETIHFI